ncbi:MAG TPA: hypothetical protein VFW07_11815 [Parafilimonas sp.]|nr:hypothetical protein [Parafilimonas sp.]
MCNCGKKRNELTQRNIHARPANNSQHSPFNITSQPTQTVLFRYAGNTALTVTGNITRRHYRFNFPGDVQHVALSDAPAMSVIHVLKRV